MFGQLEAQENKLKTSPRGFSQEHQHIALLRLKSFGIMHSVTQKEIMSDDFTSIVLSAYQEMLPFSRYLDQSVRN